MGKPTGGPKPNRLTLESYLGSMRSRHGATCAVQLRRMIVGGSIHPEDGDVESLLAELTEEYLREKQVDATGVGINTPVHLDTLDGLSNFAEGSGNVVVTAGGAGINDVITFRAGGDHAVNVGHYGSVGGNIRIGTTSVAQGVVGSRIKKP